MINFAETILSISMFFGGIVGSLGIVYLKRITENMDNITIMIHDIDNRVIRLEVTK